MMCGGDVGCPKTYGKNLISVGSGLMSGEGKVKRAAKKVEKFARKTAGKKNLKKVAGQAIEKGIPAVAGFAAGTAASSMGMNPVAGAVAGAAAEEGVRRSGVGKKLRKKAGLGVGKALKKAGRKVGHQALDEAEGLADDALSAGKKKARKALGSDKRGSGLKKTSKWIEHVKKVAKDKGIAYGEALKVAKETYQKN